MTYFYKCVKGFLIFKMNFILMKHIISNKSFNLVGSANIPGDKSISHRALIIPSMCIGKTKITGLLESEDVFATMNALKTLGVKIFLFT